MEKVESDFVPLVVEYFGVWTPFALTTPPPEVVSLSNWQKELTFCCTVAK